MLLVENWKEVIKKAWSVRLVVLAAVLSGVETIMPMIDPLVSERYPKGVFSAASGLVAAAALLARVVAQKGMSK